MALVNQRYRKVERNGSLGSGAYGVVYKALDLHTHRSVALKKIKLELDEEGIPSTTLREVVFLKQLTHPNVVRLEDVVYEEGKLFLVFEFMDKDLRKYMDQVEGPLDPALVQSYSRQLLQGLYYCHSRGVMHRDLKPHNLLVARDGTLKIADFGLARAFVPPSRPLTTEVVTRWYRSPELLLGSNTYSPSVDVWSVATIIAEMATKKALFPAECEIEQLHVIFRLLGTPNEEIWPDITNLPFWRNNFPEWRTPRLRAELRDFCAEGVDLIERMLVYDPSRRITAKDALQHEYIAGRPLSIL